MLHHHRHGDRNRQLQVPITVTTQQRGPLQLGGQTTILPSPHILCSSIARQSRVGKKIHNDPQTPRPLTRFAVTMKPIDIVEEHLREGLSCAELTHEIEHHLSQVKKRICPSLPYLSPLPLLPSYQPSTTNQVEIYTHRDTLGPLNVAITFSRPQTKSVHLPILIPSQDHTTSSSSSLSHQRGAGRLRLHRSPCAPSGLTAVLMHKREPITSSTLLSGHNYT